MHLLSSQYDPCISGKKIINGKFGSLNEVKETDKVIQRNFSLFILFKFSILISNSLFSFALSSYFTFHFHFRSFDFPIWLYPLVSAISD